MTATAPRPRSTPIDIRRWNAVQTFIAAYAALWLCTLTSAVVFAMLTPFNLLADLWIGTRLTLYPHTVPSTELVVSTAAHNVRVAIWPLVAIAFGAARDKELRALGSTLIAVFLFMNATIVGAAIGIGRSALVPFLPHLPLEWAALALVATAWTLACQREPARGRLLAVTAGFLALIVAAAVLEVYAVPHL
ncbi:hypothetical protein VSS74_16365 [Conexibacter stalactiti]|uniref:Peptidase S54 rhomboid domain-containing protein n=1 Tax=Conexibacter stalactiti TaxID=1940611 RepID=A0ABU4HV39_9ACTN|nr:hypothetical protein [Conexibacter stalactiti]MDW5595924.1 hypothetical protein [Conexibacter stalactiti]MEC5036566.1 hypothetical protein [Conexibacter stalactiti]